MEKFRAALELSKCQGYGKCAATMPGFFRLGDDRKVALQGGAETSDETVVKAAKTCPYRAIAVVDTATSEQIFPVRRR